MRRLLSIALFVAIAPAASAGLPKACGLVTNSEAARLLGGRVTRTASGTNLYSSCRWMRSHQSAAAGQVLTVQTSRSTEKRFRTGAKHEPPPVVAILGVGSEAYSAARGAVLLVWQKNIAIGFYFAGVYPAPQAAKSLAAAALKRL